MIEKKDFSSQPFLPFMEFEASARKENLLDQCLKFFEQRAELSSYQNSAQALNVKTP